MTPFALIGQIFRSLAVAIKLSQKPEKLHSRGLIALQYIRGQMDAGAREEPPGSNGGRWVWKYTAGRTGPWCAALVYTALLYSGSLPFPRTHNARKLFAYCVKHGQATERPQAGDIVLWSRGAANSRKGHIGVVSWVSANGLEFKAVSGNLGKAGRIRETDHELGEARLLGFARI